MSSLLSYLKSRFSPPTPPNALSSIIPFFIGTTHLPTDLLLHIFTFLDLDFWDHLMFDSYSCKWAKFIRMEFQKQCLSLCFFQERERLIFAETIFGEERILYELETYQMGIPQTYHDIAWLTYHATPDSSCNSSTQRAFYKDLWTKLKDKIVPIADKVRPFRYSISEHSAAYHSLCKYESIGVCYSNLQMSDFTMAKLILLKKPELLEKLTWTLRSDKRLVMISVTLNGETLKFAHPNLWEDREVVRAACLNNIQALEYASRSFREDGGFMLQAIEHHRGKGFEYLHPSLRTNRELMLRAVKCDGFILKELSDYMQSDPEMILAALKQTNGFAFKYAAQHLREDREFVKRMLQEGSGNAIVCTRFTSDLQMCMLAVNQDGLALQYVDKELLSNADLVRAAVAQNTAAQQFVPKEVGGGTLPVV